MRRRNRVKEKMSARTMIDADTINEIRNRDLLALQALVGSGDEVVHAVPPQTNLASRSKEVPVVQVLATLDEVPVDNIKDCTR